MTRPALRSCKKDNPRISLSRLWAAPGTPLRIPAASIVSVTRCLLSSRGGLALGVGVGFTERAGVAIILDVKNSMAKARSRSAKSQPPSDNRSRVRLRCFQYILLYLLYCDKSRVGIVSVQRFAVSSEIPTIIKHYKIFDLHTEINLVHLTNSPVYDGSYVRLLYSWVKSIFPLY